VNSDDFNYLSTMLKASSGLMLTTEKTYLLESRLNPIANRRKFESLEALVRAVRQNADPALKREIIEAMTTNESFFFRDKTPFDNFRDTVLPELLKVKAHRRSLRIWCAAASNGQEPYSLAMILKEEAHKLLGWTVEILGTDLATSVIDRARMGLYSQFEVQRGMPIQMLIKYFSEVGDMWQVAPEIRNMVTYKPFNLLDSFASLGQFDVIFCRNVLIYFDQDTKADVLTRLSRLLPEHGTLFLGAAETVLGLCPKFKPVPGKRGMYCLEPQQVH